MSALSAHRSRGAALRATSDMYSELTRRLLSFRVGRALDVEVRRHTSHSASFSRSAWVKCTELYCSTTAFETCGAGVVNENSDSYTKTSHALPVLFTSSAIHDRVGVKDALVELEREVMSHLFAAVAIASQPRTSRRPLTIGPTARSRSAQGLSNALCRSQCIQDPASKARSRMAFMPIPLFLH